MQPPRAARLAPCLLLLLAGACRPLSGEELADVAQAVGELLASVDEASQGGGFAGPWLRRPAAFEPAWHERLLQAAWPAAHAHATCAGLPFSACDGGVRERTLDGCYLGWGYLEGSVRLRFDDAACALGTTGAGVTRTSQVSLRGPRAGTFLLDAEGGGIRVERAADGFTATVAGFRRRLLGEDGQATSDMRARTAEPLRLSGEARAGRTLSGGVLEVRDALTGTAVPLRAGELAWDENCNCASSGALSGAASGGRGVVQIELASCGKARVWVDGAEPAEVILDRCGTL
ncbi:MAG: hypothetical protein FJ086_00250 [Deltaproteobacteria bacterium]|nr:hypothetical protein [Deltaproteobacteria bacterium]